MTPNPIFAVGETVSQYEVLDVHNQGRNWRYQVVCKRCGHEREINQGALLDVQRRQASSCRACSHHKNTKDVLEYGQASLLQLWGETDSYIAEHNRLIRQWPAPADHNGYWLWADHNL